MKYAHLADLHLGAHRDPILRELSHKAFEKALTICKQAHVDFILFAGDLFNTALPAVDTLKFVTRKLKELKEENIPLYVIAGSHDFSPSGRSMIDVLEEAGLLINVCKGEITQQGKLRLKFTIDPKTQAKITGLLGRRNQLDSEYYQELDKEAIEQEPGYKIFMFHTTLEQLKPAHIEMGTPEPLSLLPKGCNYYAGGHVHHRAIKHIPPYGPLTYTGPLFPNSFAEIEEFGQGGFFIIEENAGKQTIMPQELRLKERIALKIDATNKTPQEVTQEILTTFEQQPVQDALVTLRVAGKLSSGHVSQIGWREIQEVAQQKQICTLLRNTAKLSTPEYVETKIAATKKENIEHALIEENITNHPLAAQSQLKEMTKNLITIAAKTRSEGQTLTDFQKQIKEEIALSLKQK